MKPNSNAFWGNTRRSKELSHDLEMIGSHLKIAAEAQKWHKLTCKVRRHYFGTFFLLKACKGRPQYPLRSMSEIWPKPPLGSCELDTIFL